MPGFIDDIGKSVGDAVETGISNAADSAKSFLGSIFGNSNQQTKSTFISQYLSQMRKIGLMKANRFGIFFEIGDTQGVWGDSNFPLRNLVLSQNCQSLTVPEKTIDSLDRVIMGPKQTIPYNVAFSDSMDLVFNLSADMYEYLLFSTWQKGIIDTATREVSYYSNYAKNNNLLVYIIPNYVKNYNEAISGIYTGKFYGARLTQVYPKSVAFSQNAATVDVPLTMTVKLMFREMTTVLEDPSILAAYQDQVDSLFVPVDLNNNAWKINKAANFAINTAAMFQA